MSGTGFKQFCIAQFKALLVSHMLISFSKDDGEVGAGWGGGGRCEERGMGRTEGRG